MQRSTCSHIAEERLHILDPEDGGCDDKLLSQYISPVVRQVIEQLKADIDEELRWVVSKVDCSTQQLLAQEAHRDASAVGFEALAAEIRQLSHHVENVAKQSLVDWSSMRDMMSQIVSPTLLYLASLDEHGRNQDIHLQHIEQAVAELQSAHRQSCDGGMCRLPGAGGTEPEEQPILEATRDDLSDLAKTINVIKSAGGSSCNPDGEATSKDSAIKEITIKSEGGSASKLESEATIKENERLHSKIEELEQLIAEQEKDEQAWFQKVAGKLEQVLRGHREGGTTEDTDWLHDKMEGLQLELQRHRESTTEELRLKVAEFEEERNNLMKELDEAKTTSLEQRCTDLTKANDENKQLRSKIAGLEIEVKSLKKKECGKCATTQEKYRQLMLRNATLKSKLLSHEASNGSEVKETRKEGSGSGSQSTFAVLSAMSKESQKTVVDTQQRRSWTASQGRRGVVQSSARKENLPAERLSQSSSSSAEEGPAPGEATAGEASKTALVPPRSKLQSSGAQRRSILEADSDTNSESGTDEGS